MEQLPSPPPFLEPPQPAAIAVQPRPGQLTLKWSRLFWVGWLLVAGSFAAIWYSSRLIGLSTWWLGPETEPRVIVVNVLPFIVPLSLSVAGFQRRRSLPLWGVAGAVFVAGIAAFDTVRVPGFAAIEFALAAAGLFVSVASFAGMYRKALP